MKPVDQTEAVGHSVRATYMYSGMADIAAIEKDKAYLNAITKIWEDIVYGKMYLTGGIGATGGNEGFADPFVLPNMSAYCETCASIGDIFFNHRLFLLHGQSKYIDILEKTLYNSMLSGVSLSADRFFYPNPLESNGQHQRRHGSDVHAVLQILHSLFLQSRAIFMLLQIMTCMSTFLFQMMLILLWVREM